MIYAPFSCHFNNDYWHLQFHRDRLEEKCIRDLRNGDYFFSPCKAYSGAMAWNAQDALVLKAMALVLTDVLTPQLSQRCYHLTGHGGAKGCVLDVNDCVSAYRFVCRSDVNSYYATVNHTILRKQLASLIGDDSVLVLLGRMLDRLDDVGEALFAVEVGITKGNPLSPLLGAVYLDGMDQRLGDYFQQNDLFYGRLRENGFYFLGYRIGDKTVRGVSVAWKT